MKVKNQITTIISILLIIIFTIAIVPKEFQNDTFFTIAIGEKILNNEDVNSLLIHDNIEFVHSGFLDIFIAKIFDIGGYQGIYIFVLIMAVSQMLIYYFILNSITHKKIFALLATIVTAWFLKYEFTARAQIISFTIFLLEFYCIENIVKNYKKRYAIILLILPIILANFHSSVFPVYFAIYLPYIAQFILSKFNLKKDEDSKIIIEKKPAKALIILFILSFLCGLCTPTTFSTYTDMFKAMGGISTSLIKELQPIEVVEETYFVILFSIIFAILAFTKTKVRITDCFYILGFAIMALTTRRCIFFFYLISSICIYRIFSDYLDYKKINLDFINRKIKKLVFIIFVIFLVIHSINLIAQKSCEDFVSTEKYPIDATNYILNNVDIDNMRIFNGFDFGSYLELKGIKVFIDSRSGIYTPEFNEGCTVLEDNANVFYGSISYKTIFDKYKITHALLENTEIANIYIVDDENWKLIYQDDVFSLYERINEK